VTTDDRLQVEREAKRFREMWETAMHLVLVDRVPYREWSEFRRIGGRAAGLAFEKGGAPFLDVGEIVLFLDDQADLLYGQRRVH
jgi:hypothetical protein